MNGLIERIFEFGDGSDHDATVSEISSELDSCSNHVWNVTPDCNDLGGMSQYTIEVSNDGVCWFDYALVFTDVNSEDGVEDIQLSFKKMRINHKASTATQGTVKYLLTQKQRS